MSDRVWWGWNYVIWIVFSLVFLTLIVMPLTAMYLADDSSLASSGGAKRLRQMEDFMSQGLLLFAAAWLFFLGGRSPAF